MTADSRPVYRAGRAASPRHGWRACRALGRTIAFGASGLLLAATLLFATLAQAINIDELLEAEDAFRFLARTTGSATVEIEYEIAEGYYLYRDKFAFAVEATTAKLGRAQFPAGEVREDKFFGRSETYRTRVRITLPVESPGEAFKLIVTSQGCADVGVCYPPQQHDTVIRLAAAGPSAEQTAIRPVSPTTVAARGPASDEDYFHSLVKSGNVWATIAAFFAAGLLLAFTPRVLPMVPILSG